MKRFVSIALAAIFALQAGAWDFLYHDASGNCATRSQSPFARLDREHRTEALESSWVLIGQDWFPAVEYAGETWLCRDGTIVPATERPKRISKLDLL